MSFMPYFLLNQQATLLPNDYGVSNYYSYIHPLAAFISTLISLICTIVLRNKDLRRYDSFFCFTLVNSAATTVNSFLNIFMLVNKCELPICSVSSKYWEDIYKIFSIYYITNVYYFGNSVVQIVIEINAYLLICGKVNWLNKFSPFKICAFIYGK